MLNQIKKFVGLIFSKIFFLSFPNKWSVYISSLLSELYFPVNVNGRTFLMSASTDLLLYRSETFNVKEPETNRWIQEIPLNSIFFDVGANVGVFTVLASAYCKKVFAFEPVSHNYAVLNKNIQKNNLGDVVSAFCLAISDKSGFDTMRLSSSLVGSALHSYGVSKDACHENFNPVFQQGAFAVSLDELVYNYNFECPNYLKIDVDGNEHLIIKGASKLLSDQRLKSILIELNMDLKIDAEVIDQIKSSGFLLVEKGDDCFLKGMKIRNLIFKRAS